APAARSVLSLHDALPISTLVHRGLPVPGRRRQDLATGGLRHVARDGEGEDFRPAARRDVGVSRARQRHQPRRRTPISARVGSAALVTDPFTKGGISLTSAAAMGVGGMMGAGLYTLLGLAVDSTGSLLPFAFLLAGFAAAFSVYSYSKLGAKYPSRGG